MNPTLSRSNNDTLIISIVALIDKDAHGLHLADGRRLLTRTTCRANTASKTGVAKRPARHDCHQCWRVSRMTTPQAMASADCHCCRSATLAAAQRRQAGRYGKFPATSGTVKSGDKTAISALASRGGTHQRRQPDVLRAIQPTICWRELRQSAVWASGIAFRHARYCAGRHQR